ncbi:MAG: hypothetical protein Q9162_001261 [Coniocarpon cinnabarinum]
MSSLFGASTTNSPNLFGNTQSQAQPSNSLFASTAQSSQPQSNSLFGGTLGQPPSQKPSLFTSTQQPNSQPPSNSLFASTGLNQSQQQPANSAFGGSTLGGSAFGRPSQQPQQSQSRPLWQPGSIQPREKSLQDQMVTLNNKWNPTTQECRLQAYFYNNVGAERAPYFGPEPGEDEAKWEEALSKKPSEDAIPVLVKGFAQLGLRIRTQVMAVQRLQQRLHEINNSLVAQQQQHELEVSVRAADAKRKHIALSQRCLHLATKVQVLKNRGYVMDSAEEELKRQLDELEKKAFDPSLNARQEEVWARMVGIRERTRMLQVEAERAGQDLAKGKEDGIDEEVLKRTKKILGDYDVQIPHLNREIEAIKKDFSEWQNNNASRG